MQEREEGGGGRQTYKWRKIQMYREKRREGDVRAIERDKERERREKKKRRHAGSQLHRRDVVASFCFFGI